MVTKKKYSGITNKTHTDREWNGFNPKSKIQKKLIIKVMLENVYKKNTKDITAENSPNYWILNFAEGYKI